MKLAQLIEEKLKNEFTSDYLEILNESHQHSVPANSETHFKVVMVSPAFESVSKVARHQMIYRVLGDALKQGLHALALHLYTPKEWEQKGAQSPDSPQCMGGSKRNSA